MSGGKFSVNERTGLITISKNMKFKTMNEHLLKQYFLIINQIIRE